MAWTKAARDAAAMARKTHSSAKQAARAGATVSLDAMKHIVKRPKQSLIVGVNGNNRTVDKGKKLSPRSAASLGYFKKA